MGASDLEIIVIVQVDEWYKSDKFQVQERFVGKLAPMNWYLNPPGMSAFKIISGMGIGM